MSILWKRSISKKGSALMSVMCFMTFVIILGTVALTVTDAAHKNVVYQNKVQQAYYTAKSAADKTASYIMQHSANKNESEGTMEKELYDIYEAYNADPTAEWSDGTNYIKGKSSIDTSIGSYTVDIYPTTNPNVFKVVANSEYQGIKSSTAMLIGPTSGGTGLEDALVSTGEYIDSGSPHWAGGISANQTNLTISSGYLGGSICNTGSITINTQNGMHQQYLQDSVNSGNILRVVAGGTAYLSKVHVSFDDPSYSASKDASISVYNYYSFFVTGGDMTLHEWVVYNGGYIKAGKDAKTTEKGVLCGGKFKMDSDCRIAEFNMPLYIKSEANFLGTGTVTINGDVYIKGNLTTNMNLVINGHLYVTGSIKGENRITATGIHKGISESEFESRTTDLEKLFNEQLAYSQNATKYGKWNFTATHINDMDTGVTWNPKALRSKNSTPQSTYYKDEIINASGKLASITTDISGAGSNGGGIVFDTNVYSTDPTYDSNGKMTDAGETTGEYKDLYIKFINSIDLKVIARKPSIEVWGKGNVYLYFPSGVTWKSSEVAVYCRDCPKEAHVYFISDSTASNKNDYSLDFGSLNGSKTRKNEALRNNTTAYFYVYCPSGAINISGSSGFAGAVIAKYPNINSGSNLTELFVPPVDSKGNRISINGVGGSASYEVLLRTRN